MAAAGAVKAEAAKAATEDRSPCPSDLLTSCLPEVRAYRGAHAKSWRYDYFQHPELPEFLPRAAHDRLQDACHVLEDVLAVGVEMTLRDKLFLDDKPLFDWLGIPNHAVYWIRKHHQLQRRVLWGRPDFHWQDGRPYCLEANLASAAGFQQQASALAEYYEGHPALAARASTGKLEVRDPLVGLGAALGRLVGPGESVLFADVFEGDRHKSGERPYGGLTRSLREISDLRVFGGFIEDLELTADGARLDGQKIDHVFMGYYNPHVFARFGDFLPLWDLHAQGKLRILDGLDEILYSSKLLFAFLAEFCAHMPLPHATQRAFAAIVPWSRILRDAATELSNGEVADLPQAVLDQQQELVLKKGQSAEGKDVYLGTRLSADAWKQRVATALDEGGWIVQRYIPAAPATLATVGDEGIKTRAAVTTTSPYVANGRIVGYLNRYYEADPEKGRERSAKELSFSTLGTTAIIDP